MDSNLQFAGRRQFADLLIGQMRRALRGNLCWCSLPSPGRRLMRVLDCGSAALFALLIGLPAVRPSNPARPSRFEKGSIISWLVGIACRLFISVARRLLPECIAGPPACAAVEDRQGKASEVQISAGFDTACHLRLAAAEDVAGTSDAEAIGVAPNLACCGICLESYGEEENGPVVELTCHKTHRFHAACLGRAWRVAGAARCPMCRFDCHRLWPCVMVALQDIERKPLCELDALLALPE